MLKAFKYEIYPNKEQTTLFAKTFGCTRFIWNYMLNDKIEYYRKNKAMLYNTPAQYKDAYPFLKEIDSLALSNVQMNLEQAYKNFFENRDHFGFPNFKSKKHCKLSYTTNFINNNIRIEEGKLKLPKLGLVKINLHQPYNGKIKSATISKTKSGRYFVSLLCEVDEIKKLPKTNQSIGIDLGLTDFIILSNGEKVPNPRFLVQSSKKLRREQRKLGKMISLAKKKGIPLDECKNFQKQKLKVAKLHFKIANQRKDFLHKLSIALVRDYDLICVEKLNVKGMLKNHNLAKSISDASWSTFINFLTYKCEWYGKEIIKIDTFYPSSKRCNTCGHKNTELKLKDRVWICPECGTELDRDINAAKNILEEGLRIKLA